MSAACNTCISLYVLDPSTSFLPFKASGRGNLLEFQAGQVKVGVLGFGGIRHAPARTEQIVWRLGSGAWLEGGARPVDSMFLWARC